MTEGEDFVGNCKKRYNEPKTYLQIGISKATDIVSDISNLPRFKALMNFPFPKTSPVNPSPNRVLIPKQEETLVENNLTEVTKSISFLEKPNFDPMVRLLAAFNYNFYTKNKHHIKYISYSWNLVNARI